MNRAELQVEWESRIQKFRASGEKAIHWCKANQINRQQLHIWMKRLDATSRVRTTFLPVQMTNELKPEPLMSESSQPERSSCLRIRIGAAIIEVDAGFEPGLLREIVRALEADPVC